jgi:cysteine-rich repeat protein
VCTTECGYTCTDAKPNVCRTTCGDSKLVGLEKCDDGNTNSGDGCSADCNSVEAGWSCPPLACGRSSCTQVAGPSILGGLQVAPADSPHALVLVVWLPYTKAEFDEAKQNLFKDTISSAAGTSPLNVDILSIAEARRRAGSIEVETKIKAMDAASLQALSSTLGTGDSMLVKINSELKKRGLPASTGVSTKAAAGSSILVAAVLAAVGGAILLFISAACYFRRHRPIEPWDKYCKSWCLSDLWESDGMSHQKLYIVNQNCREFSFVKDKFMETQPNYRNSVITRVERVENRAQHDSYTTMKRNIARDITKASGTVSCGIEDGFVKWLFHGTKQDTINTIVNSQSAGYLPMLSGSKTGDIWGPGTYFARDSKYSHDYTEAKSQRKMLLNSVIVGEWAQGAPGMTYYPLAKGDRHRQCNSLVDHVDNPSIFVIQHSNQAYPAYVITYTSA